MSCMQWRFSIKNLSWRPYIILIIAEGEEIIPHFRAWDNGRVADEMNDEEGGGKDAEGIMKFI